MEAKLMCVVAVALAEMLLAAGMPQLAGATTLPGETNSSPQGVMLEEYLERNGGLVWALCRRIGVLRIENRDEFSPDRDRERGINEEDFGAGLS